MEDKRTAIAIFACIIVIMIYSELFLAPVTRPKVTTAPATQVSQNLNQQQQATSQVVASDQLPSNGTQAPALLPALTRKVPTPAEINAAASTLVENTELRIQITHLGARVKKLQLRQYKLHVAGEEVVDLVSPADNSVLPLGIVAAGIDDAYVNYTLSAVTEGASKNSGAFQIPANGELQLQFKGDLPNGSGIQKTYIFRSGSYLFDLKVNLTAPTADGSRVALEWASYAPDTVVNDRLDPPQFTYLNSARKLYHILAPEIVQTAQDSGKPLRELESVSWLALNTKYFMSALIPNEATPNALAGIEHNTLKLRAFGNSSGGDFSVYVGPKDYKILKGMGYELHRSIDLGWFSFLAFPLISIIRFFYYLLGNYGLAIILLTLVIKALFLPLTKASFKSMKAMQDLQPEVKALRERIKDATQLNQEMMALYKRKGVNPMGGCFPILIQLPVFLGLYNALLSSIEMRHAPFALWINDLSAPEHLMLGGIGIPVMVLLMGASMFLQQLTTPATGDPAQRKAMLFMPIIFTVMFVIFPFPAGLVLYWLVNNLISIIQQMYLNKSRSINPLQATIVASVLIFCFGWVLTLI